MKKRVCFLLLVPLCFVLFAQETADEYTGKEIENAIGAVREAEPGDYIVLKSGKNYILTKEEIDIARGSFDFEDLSGLNAEYRDDGTEIKTISEAHVVFIYSDGQISHLFKTGISFDSYLKYIDTKYNIAPYLDFFYDLHDSIPIKPRPFDVFRAVIQNQKASNGVDEIEIITVTVYNDKGENFRMKYCSEPDMVWGNISEEGAYSPVGETRQIEFEIE